MRQTGFSFTWQNLITSIGLVVLLAGGYWTLAYLPISSNISELKQANKDLTEELALQRKEAVSRQDLQNTLTTTRLEFLAEIKRLDQRVDPMMPRREFEAWKMERDVTISGIRDRQNRFAEALDAMYSKIMQQQPLNPRQ